MEHAVLIGLVAIAIALYFGLTAIADAMRINLSIKINSDKERNHVL